MSEHQQPGTLDLKSLMPALTVNDLPASLAWYRDVLGFGVAEEYQQDGKVVGARLLAGSIGVLLTQDDFAKGRDRQKGVGIRFYFVTGQDVDRLAAAVRERGGQLAHEPRDEPWGVRDFAVVDPDGYQITISTQPPS